MYYIPAGIFASSVPEYASLASEAGIALSVLTWGNFFLKNLLPVTLGNIAGGCADRQPYVAGACGCKRKIEFVEGRGTYIFRYIY